MCTALSPGETLTRILFDQISDQILRRIIDRTVVSCQNIGMNIVEYWELVKTAHDADKSQRLPQVAFNVLHKVRPDLAEQVCATDADPFYATHLWEPNAVKFCQYISLHW